MPERDDPLWHFVHNRLPGPPSSRFLGWRCVELDVARGTIAVEFAPKPACLNPAGGIAGGDLRDPDNRLLATATATLRIVTIPNVELDFGQGVASHKL